MDQPTSRARDGFTRTWLPPLLGIAVFLAALVGTGTVLGDWYWRNAEMNHVVTSIEASEQAMTTAQARFTQILTDYGKGQGGAQATATLDAEIRTAAAEGYRAVRDAGEQVASVRVAAWHPRIAAARDAYVAHNAEWQKFLSQVSQDAAMLDSTDNKINPTFMAAEQAVRDALPVDALFQLQERIDTIFAPASETASDSGGMMAA